MTHVLLVEDNPEIRDGVATVIDQHPNLELVAAATCVADAFEALEQNTLLDVAVVDLGLPDGHGNDVIARVTQNHPAAASLVFTVMADQASIFTALHAGARGYLLKDATPEELTAAIEHAETGGAPMSPEVARKVVDSFHTTNREQPGLTPREQEILELLCHGSSYLEVASMLSIGRGTVQTHVKSIYRKLDVSSKAEATKVAVQLRLFIP